MTAQEVLESLGVIERIVVAASLNRADLTARQENFRRSTLGTVASFLGVDAEITGALQGISDVSGPLTDSSRASALSETDVANLIRAYRTNTHNVHRSFNRALSRLTSNLGSADRFIRAACDLELRLDGEVFPPVAPNRVGGVPADIMHGFRSYGFPAYVVGPVFNKRQISQHLMQVRKFALEETDTRRLAERVLEYVRDNLPARERHIALQAFLVAAGIPARFTFGRYHLRGRPPQQRGWSEVRIGDETYVVDHKKTALVDSTQYQEYAPGQLRRFRYTIERV